MLIFYILKDKILQINLNKTGGKFCEGTPCIELDGTIELDCRSFQVRNLRRLREKFDHISPNAPTAHLSEVHTYSRRCHMWKSGIHWLMEEGVECFMEVVKECKGVVVVVRSEEGCAVECDSVFMAVVQKVLDTAKLYSQLFASQYCLLLACISVLWAYSLWVSV